MFFLEDSMDVVYASSLMQKGLVSGNLDEIKEAISKGVSCNGEVSDTPYVWVAANQKHIN